MNNQFNGTYLKAESRNFIHPVIPNGYRNILEKWNAGFAIQDKRGNQFIWIPVGNLFGNGTLDGKNFLEKFGRRNYQNNIFSKDAFHENMDDDLKKQVESVGKYGGFYVGRYTVSKGADGMFYTIKGRMPLTNINFYDSLKVAKMLGQGDVTSHMLYGTEYDSILEWLLATGKTMEEVSEDSTNFGNYYNGENTPKKVVETGSHEEWKTNEIYDLAGNVWEWIQEMNHNLHRVIRGGAYNSEGYRYPIGYRGFCPADYCGGEIGFRVALYIE